MNLSTSPLLTATVRISYRGSVAEHTIVTDSGNPIYAAKEAEAALEEASSRVIAMIAGSHGDVR